MGQHKYTDRKENWGRAQKLVSQLCQSWRGFRGQGRVRVNLQWRLGEGSIRVGRLADHLHRPPRVLRAQSKAQAQTTLTHREGT